MTPRALICAAGLALLPLAGWAQDLSLPPGGTRTAEFYTPSGSFAMPTSGWRDGALQLQEASGAVLREVWRYTASALTSDQIMTAVQLSLSEAGFDISYQCADDLCGGYDFRFGWEVIGEPAMHVDLGDFRYLYAERAGADGPEHVSVLVSRSPGAAYLQIVRVGPDGAVRAADTVTSSKAPDARAATSPKPSADGPAPAPQSLAEALLATGHVVLEDLVFATGSSNLGDGEFASLKALAAFMEAHPDARLVLVGHTDDEGALSSNIALSKRRATSVRQALIRRYGVDAGRMGAEGVGYLSPITSNASDEGRTKNRRVEAVLTSTR